MGLFSKRALICSFVLCTCAIHSISTALAAHNGGHLSGSSALLGPADTGYLMKADDVDYDVNNHFVTALGHVEIDHNDRILTAEKVTYDQTKDVVVAEGNVVMMSPDGNVVFTPRATLTNQMRDAVLEGFRALIGQNGRMAAIYATRKDANITKLERATFTPCKICNQPGKRTPLWQVKAYHVIYNQTDHKIVYHDAIFDMFGVPIAYTPYFSQADPTVKRETGFLAPDIGSSTVLGTYVKLPYYVSLTDSRDFTVQPIISSKGGGVLETEYRERWNHGGMWLQATIAENPNGGIDGNQHEWYSSLFGSGRTAIDDANSWRFGYDVQLTSNPTYLERYSLYNKDDQLVSDLFFQGQSGRSRFAITGYFFQSIVGICPTTPCTTTTPSPLYIKTANIPLVLPLIEYTYIPLTPVLGGDFRFDLNSASIARSAGPTDERATAEVNWSLPLVADNGMLLTFRADARGDVYRVTNDDLIDFPDIPERVRYISRGLPYVSLDWRWPFISGNGTDAFVVEPIMQAIAAPYGGNPKGIPDEDAIDIEFSENDVFSMNHLPGYDLVESGPRANVGLRTEAFFPGGSVEAILGEVLRLKPDPIFSSDTGLADKQSDVVGRFAIKFPPNFSLTDRLDVDQDTGNVRRNEVYLDGNFGRSSFEVSYVRLPQSELLPGIDTREEVNAQATLGFLDYWLIYAAARRDLANDAMLGDEFGLGYDDECLGISLSYRRQYTRDRDVPPSTSVLFRFNLKTGDQSAHATQLFPQHIFSSTEL